MSVQVLNEQNNVELWLSNQDKQSKFGSGYQATNLDVGGVLPLERATLVSLVFNVLRQGSDRSRLVIHLMSQ